MANSTIPTITDLDEGGDVLYIVPVVILGLSICLANLATFIILIHRRHELENHVIVISSLCIADIFNGITVVLFGNDRIQLARCGAFELVVGMVTFLGMFAPQWHTICLSVDRLVAIHWALHYHLIITPSKLRLMIISAWTVSLVEAIIVNTMHYVGFCGKNDIALDVWTLFPSVQLLSTFLILAAIYSHLWRVARRQRRQIREQHDQGRTFDKASIHVFIIVGLFILLWTPYMLCSLLGVVGNAWLKERVFSVELYCAILGCTNSLINCIVYVTLNRKLRKYVVKILTKCC